MSDFKNPFTGLNRREYNITNLKKVLDTFPTSLQTKQLTSTELLERLEDIIADRDMRIEELLAQLGNRNAVGSDIDSINDQLNDLTDSLDLESFVEENTESTELDARIQSLKGQGYVQIGNTPLYALVEEDPEEDFEWHMDHTKEADKMPVEDLKSPHKVKLENVSKEEDVWFMKEERWTSDEDGFYNANRFSSSGFGPTNLFKFIKYPSAHKRAYKIPKDSSENTSLTLYYRSRGELKDSGLKRSGETNKWLGNMIFKAQTGSKTGLSSTEGTDVGRMKLWRDRS